MIEVEIIKSQIRFLENEVLKEFSRHNKDEVYMHKQVCLSIESLKTVVQRLEDDNN